MILKRVRRKQWNASAERTTESDLLSAVIELLDISVQRYITSSGYHKCSQLKDLIIGRYLSWTSPQETLSEEELLQWNWRIPWERLRTRKAWNRLGWSRKLVGSCPSLSFGWEFVTTYFRASVTSSAMLVNLKSIQLQRIALPQGIISKNAIEFSSWIWKMFMISRNRGAMATRRGPISASEYGDKCKRSQAR